MQAHGLGLEGGSVRWRLSWRTPKPLKMPPVGSEELRLDQGPRPWGQTLALSPLPSPPSTEPPVWGRSQKEMSGTVPCPMLGSERLPLLGAWSVCTCACGNMCVHVHGHACVHACVSMRVHVCVCLCIHVCARLCVRVCLCVCVSVNPPSLPLLSGSPGPVLGPRVTSDLRTRQLLGRAVRTLL